MTGGYMGKLLFVDLSTGEMRSESPDVSLYRDYVGGYGLGARMLYSRMRPGVDPLGPDNMLGLVTGPLTGTPAVMGCRYAAVGKSPLTGGWGDANSGGDFGPSLKSAGYDAVFFTGTSSKPVYLSIVDGKAELEDASHLWGKDVYEVEAALKRTFGKGSQVSLIGPAGEKQACIACIVTKRGASAGRSGLGAVMGSKKLKAVVVKGEQEVPVADMARAERLRREMIAEMHQWKVEGNPYYEGMHKYGTSETTANCALNGDSPIKNWGGVGVSDFPNVGGISGDGAIAGMYQHETCWRCPVACEGLLAAGKGDFKWERGLRRAEYETQASFGGLSLNSSAAAVNAANDTCNRYGLDTISAGAVVAFAIECFENGILNLEDTDGISLRWGDGKAMVAMVAKVARREGLGDVLADGVEKAARRIGRGAEKFAVHIGGQDLGMHDPKFQPWPEMMAGARYVMDATPGRHTQSWGPASYKDHLVNASGLCGFGYFCGEPQKWVQGFLAAVTGWERSWQELEVNAQRVMAIRQAFNSREGINARRLFVHPRIMATPLPAGPTKGQTVDLDKQIEDGCKALDWDPATGKPNKNKLTALGMADVAKDLWG